jgi:hypothetical protein
VCRNIRPLYNFDPPASDEEIRAAALQFVRKISGFDKPSKANEAAFNAAVDEITEHLQPAARLTGNGGKTQESRARDEPCGRQGSSGCATLLATDNRTV